MGNWLSGLFSKYSNDPLRTILIGLDNAGKTTLLYRTHSDETLATIPTIGFNVETVEPIKGLQMTVWDLGGQGSIRSLWQYYIQNCEAIIWIVDSNDEDRMEESRKELEGILEGTDITCPLLVFANKQDLPNAMAVEKVKESLGLDNHKRRPWHIQGCIATQGEGLNDGYQKLVELLNR